MKSIVNRDRAVVLDESAVRRLSKYVCVAIGVVVEQRDRRMGPRVAFDGVDPAVGSLDEIERELAGDAQTGHERLDP